MYVYIYIYINMFVWLLLFRCAVPPDEDDVGVELDEGKEDQLRLAQRQYVGWSDNRFNDLRFKNIQNINDRPAAHVVVSCVPIQM